MKKRIFIVVVSLLLIGAVCFLLGFIHLKKEFSNDMTITSENFIELPDGSTYQYYKTNFLEGFLARLFFKGSKLELDGEFRFPEHEKYTYFYIKGRTAQDKLLIETESKKLLIGTVVSLSVSFRKAGREPSFESIILKYYSSEGEAGIEKIILNEKNGGSEKKRITDLGKISVIWESLKEGTYYYQDSEIAARNSSVFADDMSCIDIYFTSGASIRLHYDQSIGACYMPHTFSEAVYLTETGNGKLKALVDDF